MKRRNFVASGVAAFVSTSSGLSWSFSQPSVAAKTVLRLPDLEHAKTAVLNSLTQTFG